MASFSLPTPPYMKDDIPQSAGNTPLQAVHLSIKGQLRTIHLKLENKNPTGSMKDRTANGLIQDLEEKKLLHKDATLIESTSGNLGVALAQLCKQRGYRFLAVIDPKTTAENIARMEAFGAQIALVRQCDAYGGYLLSRLAHIQELLRRNKTYVWPNQYVNEANPRAHYQSTGPEIYQQMQQKIDAVFIPASTGGTLAGIGRYMREVSPLTKIIGVDAYGSIIFGTCAAPRKLTGIGSSRPSSFITRDLYDHVIHVRDEEAFAYCHALLHKTGHYLGGSSGCVLFACAYFLADHPEATNVVCVCADSGENYAGTIYNPIWTQQLFPELFHAQLAQAMEIILA